MQFPRTTSKAAKLRMGRELRTPFSISMLFSILGLLLLLTCSVEFALASSPSQLLLTWQASPTSSVTGYKILVGSEHANYTASIEVGNNLAHTLSNLNAGSDYYVAVVAHDSGEGVSSPSNELHISIPQTEVVPPPPSPPPPPSNTTPPPPTEPTRPGLQVPVDSDRDGISDSDEVRGGTNPQIADTDGDLIEDCQEMTDGTDPLDPGSSLKPLSTQVCAEWNGFLGGMYNILEHMNLTAKTLRVKTTLYDLQGKISSQTRFTLTPHNQHDLLVHDLPGWSLNKIGRVCSSHDGAVGDIDGRMVYYKIEPGADSAKDFQFAFAMPFLNSISGTQYVPFNTYQPSFDPTDANNLVANWIQITNQTSEPQTGALEFYSPDGKLIGKDSLSLRAGARADVAGHQFGPNLVGLVKWNPENINAGFTVRNVRYLYDNASLEDSFNTAFQLGGTKGTGQTISVPISTKGRTAVLELSNAGDSQISVDVRVSNASGSEKGHFKVKLAAHASQHLILDQTLLDSTGVAIVKSCTRGSLVATAMHYVRKDTGKILYMYGIQAEEALGLSKRGSYNTFLGQTSTLVVANRTDVQQKISLSLTRVGGKKMTLPRDSKDFAVPANGLLELNLNTFEEENKYGVVQIDLENKGTLSAWLLREKPGNYIMTTLVR